MQPNHYNHLFEVEIVKEATSNYYSSKDLDKLLKGEHATVINAFRALLKDPIFKWDIKRDKETFRAHVLKQVDIGKKIVHQYRASLNSQLRTGKFMHFI